MTTIGSAVKEERHDEAEIAELAAKMVEAHKTQAAKVAIQQVTNHSLLGSSQTSQAPGSILNYLQRKPTTTGTGMAAQPTNGSNGHTTVAVDEGKPADDESLKGHFGWESFSSGKIHIPYIIRQTEKYCAVRIVEQKLLNKYLNVLHQDLYNCTSVRSYYITDVEARLLDEINFRHCDQYFGKEKFSMKDLIVRLSDAQKFQQFLEVCYKKLTNFSTPNDKCGFIRINSESVVPYTVRDGQKMVPLFYFEGETDNLKLKADSLSGWDLSYLKFCCKVQGIRNELFASETVAVISLDDIKSYFPQGTIFEDYWPNKVVDTQLLVAQKSHNSTINWTHPPPKQITTAATVQRTQQVQQKPAQRPMTGNSVAGLQQMYQNNVDMNYLRTMQQSGMTNQQASLAAQALSNGWSSQLTQSQFDQMMRLSTGQSKQTSSSTGRSYSRQQQQQMQSLLQSQLYPYANSNMSMSSNGHSRSGTQQPPPLVRSQQQSQLSISAVAALQLQQAQASAANKRAQNGQYLNGNQTSRSMQSSSSSASTRLQQQMQSSLTGLNGYGAPAYKIEKSFIENQMVHCINMIPYSPNSDMIIPLSEMRDQFYPNANLDVCKRVMQALDINLYSGTKPQYQAYTELGKTIADSVPFVRVCDVMTYMPQINYMVRGQMQDAKNASKRARIS